MYSECISFKEIYVLSSNRRILVNLSARQINCIEKLFSVIFFLIDDILVSVYLRVNFSMTKWWMFFRNIYRSDTTTVAPYILFSCDWGGNFLIKFLIKRNDATPVPLEEQYYILFENCQKFWNNFNLKVLF